MKDKEFLFFIYSSLFVFFRGFRGKKVFKLFLQVKGIKIEQHSLAQPQSYPR